MPARVSARVTVTPVTGPFCAQTCTVQVAFWPCWKLSADAWMLTHRSTAGADEADAVGEGDAEAVTEAVGLGDALGAGSAWHWEETAPATGAAEAVATCQTPKVARPHMLRQSARACSREIRILRILPPLGVGSPAALVTDTPGRIRWPGRGPR